MSFADFKARQPGAARFLESAIGRDRLPHALFFSGPEGPGQREGARELAKALFCAERKGAAGCSACVSCRLVEAGNHPDLRVYAPEKDSGTIRIEAVRGMLGDAFLKPFQAPAKLFVIDPAEALNEVGQNALLKVLEEPPPHTFFALICHAPEKILSTIRSRAQTLVFEASAASGTEAEDELASVKAALIERARRGRGARNPDLGVLTREEAAETLEAGIQALRESLRQSVSLDDRASEGEWIRRIETLAEFKEKISQNVNTKLALSVLWEQL